MSDFYKYHYTTINKVIKDLSVSDISCLNKIVTEVCKLPGYEGKYQLFQGDVTSTFHSYSNCMKDRGYVYNAMEQIPFQKKIKVGYRYSYINVSGRWDLNSPHWSLPCNIKRVGLEDKSEAVLLQQLSELAMQSVFSKTKLNVIALDSGYGTAEYLGKIGEQCKAVKDDLVSIVALRRGRKIWASYQGEYNGHGSPQIYGAQYYLSDSSKGDKIGLGTIPAVKTIIKNYTNSKNKVCHIELSLWSDMKLRTKDGVDMKAVSFSVVRVRQIDVETGEVKGKPLWLAIHGKRKQEIDLWEVFSIYKCRFDVEHYFRFGKQKLLLNDYQTPEIEHYDTWHQIVAIAYWFLYAASQEVQDIRMPWETKEKSATKEREENFKKKQYKTPAQTHKGMELFISTLENIVSIPKSRNKGKGREKDIVLTKRIRYKVVRKGEKHQQKCQL